MNRIDVNVPHYSKYMAGLHIPYLFAGRHWSVACTKDLPINERIKHIALGILLCIPLIGHAITYVQYIRLSKNGSHASVNPVLASHHIPIPNPTLLGKEKPVTVEQVKKDKVKDKTEISIKQLRIDLYNRMMTNPYLVANRKEIRSSTTSELSIQEVEPFFEAIKQGDLKTISAFLNNSYFKQLNSTYLKVVEGTVRTDITPLIETIIENKLEIFNLLIEDRRVDLNLNCEHYSTALHVACSLGKQGESFIRALLLKKVNPHVILNPSDLNPHVQKLIITSDDKQKNLIPLEIAKRSGVSEHCLQLLLNYIEKNQFQGDYTALQIAIMGNDLEAFEKALKDGISPNIPNKLNRQSALHMAIHCPDPKLALRMCKRLLEEGAYINSEDVWEITPFLYLCSQYKEKMSAEIQELAVMLLTNGANLEMPSNTGVSPINLMFNYPSFHPLKKMMLKHTEGQLTEQENCTNLSTVFGVPTAVRVGKKIAVTDGDNFLGLTFELLAAVFHDFLNNDPEAFAFIGLKKTVDLAKEMATSNDLESVWRCFKEALDAQEHPIIIPSGWDHHATAIVIFKDKLVFCNRGERYIHQGVQLEPGLYIFEFKPKLFDQALLVQVLESFLCKEHSLKREAYFDTVVNKLAARKIKYIGRKEQGPSNCTWSSSASLGLRAARLLEQSSKTGFTSFVLDQILNAQMKRFNHFTKHWLMKKYMKDLHANVGKMPCMPNSELMKTIAIKLCKKIQNGKDVYGFYRKALDQITYSGISFHEYSSEFSTSEEVTHFYASLYRKSEEPTQFLEHFIKSLKAIEHYEVGNWILRI